MQRETLLDAQGVADLSHCQLTVKNGRVVYDFRGLRRAYVLKRANAQQLHKEEYLLHFPYRSCSCYKGINLPSILINNPCFKFLNVEVSPVMMIRPASQKHARTQAVASGEEHSRFASKIPSSRLVKITLVSSFLWSSRVGCALLSTTELPRKGKVKFMGITCLLLHCQVCVSSTCERKLRTRSAELAEGGYQFLISSRAGERLQRLRVRVRALALLHVAYVFEDYRFSGRGVRVIRLPTE